MGLFSWKVCPLQLVMLSSKTKKKTANWRLLSSDASDQIPKDEQDKELKMKK